MVERLRILIYHEDKPIQAVLQIMAEDEYGSSFERAPDLDALLALYRRGSHHIIFLNALAIGAAREDNPWNNVLQVSSVIGTLREMNPDNMCVPRICVLTNGGMYLTAEHRNKWSDLGATIIEPFDLEVIDAVFEATQRCVVAQKQE